MVRGFLIAGACLVVETSSRHVGSVMVQGLSGSVACGIFPGQGSNQCPLH